MAVQKMYWSIGIVATVLGALCLPGIGEYLAILIIGVSLIPVVTLQSWLVPVINGIADANGFNRSYTIVAVAAAVFFCVGVFGFGKALFGSRRSNFAALGVLSWGYLVVTAFAYLRLGQGLKF
jgi:hypothetical protein